jgi:membrane protein implicated in regulation of membrane protease activity
MKNNLRISRAARRYILLQLPGAVLLVFALILARRWIDIPGWLFWGLIVLWVGKDVVLFPFVRKAYEVHEEENPMVGTRGVAVERLAPSGFIRIGGELWKAEVANGHRAIETGEAVQVRDARGLTLIVEPVEERTREERPGR